MIIWPETQLTLSLASILWVIIFFVVNAVKLATYKAGVDNRIVNLETKCEKVEKCVKTLEDNHNDNALVIMEIKTKLANIESLLVELKNK